MRGVGGKFDYAGKYTREQAILTMLRLYPDYYFSLRGDFHVLAQYTELRYAVGRDYVKVYYEDDGNYSTLDRDMKSKWLTHPVTKLYPDEYDIEKAVALFPVGGEVRVFDFTQLAEPTLAGKSTKWDYGWMTMSIFPSNGSIVTFQTKPIRGYMTQVDGYKYGYPSFQRVVVKQIPIE